MVEFNFGDAIIGGTELLSKGSVQPSGESAATGLQDITTRTKMSFFGDTFEEKEKVFQNTYPKGELRYSPNTKKLQFKTDANTSFQDLDKPFLDSLVDGGEFLTDIAEFFASAPEIAPEIWMAAKSRGVSLIPFIARLGLTGAVTEAGQQGLQEIYGSQKQTPSEAYIDETLRTGAYSTGGAAAGRFIENIISGLRGGSGLFKVSDEAKQFQQAASDLNVSEPLPGQVITKGFGAPIIKRLSGQSAALTGDIRDYLHRMENETFNAINNLTKKDTIGQIVVGLDTAYKNKEKELFNLLKVAPKETNFIGAGKNIQTGIKEWDKAALASVRSKYLAAKSLLNEDVKFDISNVFKVADKLEEGVKAATLEGGTKNVKPINSALQSVIDDIKILDPNKVDIDVLQALQQRVFDMTLPPPGQASTNLRLPEYQAKQLYTALKNSFENPMNKGTKEFANAWSTATKSAAKRFETLEKLAIIDASKSESPSQLAARLFQPYNSSNVLTLKEVISKDKFNAVGKEFERFIIGDGLNINKNLNRFDKQTLNVLIGKPRVKEFKNIGNAIDEINQSGIKPAVRDQSLAKPFISQLLNTKSSKAITEVEKLLGPSQSSLNIAVRSGIIDNIINKSSITEQGIKKLDYNKLDTVLKQYEETGILNILLPEELKALKNARIVMDFMREGTDAGTSLQAAEAVSGLRGFSLRALGTLIEATSVGRLFTSKIGRRILIGAGKENIPNRNIIQSMQIFLNSYLKTTQQQEKNKTKNKKIDFGSLVGE